MEELWQKNFINCELGDKRLNERALRIGKGLSEGFGKGLSEIFGGRRELKRAYEFLGMQKQNLTR